MSNNCRLTPREKVVHENPKQAMMVFDTLPKPIREALARAKCSYSVMLAQAYLHDFSRQIAAEIGDRPSSYRVKQLAIRTIVESLKMEDEKRYLIPVSQ